VHRVGYCKNHETREWEASFTVVTSDLYLDMHNGNKANQSHMLLSYMERQHHSHPNYYTCVHTGSKVDWALTVSPHATTKPVRLHILWFTCRRNEEQQKCAFVAGHALWNGQDTQVVLKDVDNQTQAILRIENTVFRGTKTSDFRSVIHLEDEAHIFAHEHDHADEKEAEDAKRRIMPVPSILPHMGNKFLNNWIRQAVARTSVRNFDGQHLPTWVIMCDGTYAPSDRLYWLNALTHVQRWLGTNVAAATSAEDHNAITPEVVVTLAAWHSWACPYLPDKTNGGKDDIDVYCNLRVNPVPVTRAGDCEDAALDVSLCFWELQTSEHMRTDPILAQVQAVARTLCCFTVEGFIHDHELHVFTVFIPWTRVLQMVPTVRPTLTLMLELEGWLKPGEADIASVDDEDSAAALPSLLFVEPTDRNYCVWGTKHTAADDVILTLKTCHDSPTMIGAALVLQRLSFANTSRLFREQHFYKGVARMHSIALYNMVGATSLLVCQHTSDGLVAGVLLDVFMAPPKNVSQQIVLIPETVVEKDINVREEQQMLHAQRTRPIPFPLCLEQLDRAVVEVKHDGKEVVRVYEREMDRNHNSLHIARVWQVLKEQGMTMHDIGYITIAGSLKYGTALRLYEYAIIPK
jgi:hypothetical protein